MLLKIAEKIARNFNALLGFPDQRIECSRLTILCIGFWGIISPRHEKRAQPKTDTRCPLSNLWCCSEGEV
jgi:hypothetical protein